MVDKGREGDRPGLWSPTLVPERGLGLLVFYRPAVSGWCTEGGQVIDQACGQQGADSKQKAEDPVALTGLWFQGGGDRATR